jgi:hypothetical protein
LRTAGSRLERDGVSTGLFRRHVIGGADDEARPGQPLVGVRPLDSRGGSQLRQTEVDDLHEPVGPDHDVLGLQVTVNDARLVRLRQARHDLPADLQGRPEGERSAVEPVAKRLSRDEFHDDVRLAVELSRLEDRDEVRMREGRGRPRFLYEPGERRWIGRVLGEDLERDVAP